MAAGRGAPRGAWAYVGAFVVLAAVLRFAGLDQSFSFDEAYGVDKLLDRPLGEMLSTLPLTESSPPLHYLAAWTWGQVFGLGEVGVRSLSVLAGTAAVPVAYAAGRELASARAGLIAAALVAVNPLLIFYSQEARAYALLTLLGALSFWLFARALRHPGARPLALWALAAALALLTHYFAVFLVVAQAAWLLLAARRGRLTFAAVGAVMVVALALAPLILEQADGRTGWIAQTGVATRAHQTLTKFVVGEIDPVSNAVLALVLLAGAAGLAWCLRSARREDLRGAEIALGVGGTALLVPLVLDLAGFHYLIARNAIAALPILLIGVGVLLGATRARRGPLVATAACVLCAAVALAGWNDERLQRADLRGAAESLRRSPATTLVAPYLSSAQLSVYAPGYRLTAPGAATASVDVIEPIRRRDNPGPARAPTPPPPPGFSFAGRETGDGYTRVRYRATAPRPLLVAHVNQLSPPQPPWNPVVLVGPGAD